MSYFCTPGHSGRRAIAQAIRDWCASAIDFVPDPPNVELLYRPEYLARCALGLHPAAGRVISREPIGDDDLGRMRTLHRMRRLVAVGARDPCIRVLAWRIIHDVPIHGARLGVDCDDVATLGGALAKACGLPVQFRAVAFLDFSRPYGHVFTEIRLPSAGGGLVIDIDITREAQGAPPPWYVTRQVVVPA